MKFKIIFSAVAIAAFWLWPSALNAQIFSDLDMTDSGNWNVNASPLSPTNFDYVASWGVSYTSALGVPQDPYSISTTALQLKINETSGEQAGVTVSPIGLQLSTNFVMTFDMWLNYNSGGFTTGSTQVGSYGIATNARTATWAGVGGGQLFGDVTDNGSTVDYRGYNNGVSIGSSPFAAGSQNEIAFYYTNLFPSAVVPPGETALDTNQYGSSYAGTVSFQWVKVNVTYFNGVLSESINGHLIASYSTFSIGSAVFLGMYDINNGSAGTNGLNDQNYVLFDNVRIEPIPPVPFTFSAIVGTTNAGAADGASTDAAFNGPHSTAVDANDNVYVADTGNNTIRGVTFDGTAWVANTIAGMATNSGSTDGTNNSALFNSPEGVAVDRAGNVYVADTGNSIIRKISLSGTNWITLTIAGNVHTNGSIDGTNLNSEFYQPEGIAVDHFGNIYIADTFNDTIRMIAPVGTNYITTTYAGSAGTTGTNDGMNSTARFNQPQALAVDGVGNVYVADTGNSTIRKISLVGTNRLVTTIAGLAGFSGYEDGENGNTRFFNPEGIAADSAGNLYVADSGNVVIRMMIPAGTNWVITTVGGDPGVSGFADGLGTNSQFTPHPEGISVDAFGSLFIDDNYVSEGLAVFGGISLLGDDFMSGSGDQYWINVKLGPPSATNSGAAWGLQGDPVSSLSYSPTYTRYFTTASQALQFQYVDGWNEPTNTTIDIPSGVFNTVVTNLYYIVWAPVMNVSRSGGLTITGTINTTYNIQYCTDVTSGSWQNLTTITLKKGPNQIEAWPPPWPSGNNARQTFYRAVWTGK